MLNSKTEIAKFRADVIFYMRLLLRHADKVIVLDADLSDVCINFIKVCMDCTDDECIIYSNEYKLPGYDFFVNKDKTPASLVQQAIERIKNGENLLILTDSKSFSAAYSTKNLERLFIKKCNLQASDILVIDAESVSDPKHAAFGCISGVNDVVGKNRIVIASPVIATGISIDTRGHFSAVYGIFHGVQNCDSVRQQLARLRDNVPRYLWINHSGLTRIGNGSTVPSELIDASKMEFRLSLTILKFDEHDDEFKQDCEALSLFAKMAARLNSEAPCYRDIICDRLLKEGHRLQLQEISKIDGADNFREEIKTNRDENYQDELEGICSCEQISEESFSKLKSKKAKTARDRQKERKFEITRRYGDCSPEIIKKDDDGWYAGIRMHYFLLNPDLASDRDRDRLARELERDRHWEPDIHLWSVRVKLLQSLAVPNLIARKITASDLEQFMNLTDMFKTQIQQMFGWMPTQPIARFRKFCSLLGLSLKRVGRQGSGDRLWIYFVAGLDDGRDKVFDYWNSVLYRGDTKSVPNPSIYNDSKNVDVDVTPSPAATQSPAAPTPSPAAPSPSIPSAAATPAPLPQSPSPAPIPCKVWWYSGWASALYYPFERIARLLTSDRKVKIFDACQIQFA